jgi:hypothetical protein
MINALLFAVTLASGVPSQESHYDAICVSLKKGDLSQYDCTLSNKDLSPDPRTCKNFDLKEAIIQNRRGLKATMHATCRQYQDGAMELEVTLAEDPTQAVSVQESQVPVKEVVPGKADTVIMKYDDAPARDLAE